MENRSEPNHFKPNGQFWVDVSFDGPLPHGAIPILELAGPIDHPNDMQFTLSTGGNSMTSPLQPAGKVWERLSGNVPSDISHGTYKITRLRIEWTVGSPPGWQPVDLPIDHLETNASIVIDPADYPPQPPVPRVTGIS